MTFDKKDLILLSELLKNGRLSYTDLAKKLNMSVPAVTKRLDKLQESHVIARFTIDINYELLTPGTPTIYLVKCNKKDISKVSERLYELPCVKEIYQTAGNFSLVVITHFIQDLERQKLLNLLQSWDEIEDYDMLYVRNVLPDKKELPISDTSNIELICDYCKRSFSGEIFTKVIGGKKRYFCCNTCLTEFEKKFKRRDD